MSALLTVSERVRELGETGWAETRKVGAGRQGLTAPSFLHEPGKSSNLVGRAMSLSGQLRELSEKLAGHPIEWDSLTVSSTKSSLKKGTALKRAVIEALEETFADTPTDAPLAALAQERTRRHPASRG